MRNRRARAQAALERALRDRPFDAPSATTLRRGRAVDARADIDVQRVRVGPLCEWCKTPIDVTAGDGQARCSCGLP